MFHGQKILILALRCDFGRCHNARFERRQYKVTRESMICFHIFQFSVANFTTIKTRSLSFVLRFVFCFRILLKFLITVARLYFLHEFLFLCKVNKNFLNSGKATDFLFVLQTSSLSSFKIRRAVYLLMPFSFVIILT